MNRPVAVTLFSGAGGADLGLREAGFDLLRCIEWDEDAHATSVAAGLPSVHGDVRDLSLYDGIGKIDLLWASPPCQAFSSSGKRLGALDERNGWPWTIDAIDHLARTGRKPTWVACENVPGLTHHVKGCDRLGDPLQCRGCYWSRWIVPEFERRFERAYTTTIDAAGHGVPQRRKRVFLVAGPAVPFAWPSPTHGDPAGSKQVSLLGPALLPWVTVRQALGIGSLLDAASGIVKSDMPSPTVPGNAQGKGGHAGLFESHEAGGRHLREAYEARQARKRASGVESHPVDTSRVLDLDSPAATLRAQGNKDASGHLGGHAGVLVPIEGDLFPTGWCREDNASSASYREVRSLDEPAGTLAAGGNDSHVASGLAMAHGVPVGAQVPVGAPRVDETGRPTGREWPAGSQPGRLDQLSVAVTASEGKGMSQSRDKVAARANRASDGAFLAAGIRRLSVAECAALQSFPPGYPFQGTITARYRQVGNAVPPPVARAIGESILSAMKASERKEP